jgi:uncharacterized protein
MSEQQNLDLVRRAYEAFGRGDIATLLDLFDANIEFVTPGPPELPTAGTRRGRQQVADFFQAVDALFEFERFEPETFLADGDRVVVLGRDRSRIKTTGTVIESEWAHVYDVRDGKIARMQEYIDTAPVVADLGAARART